MTTPNLPPAVLAALDQRVASIGTALDALVDQARDLGDDDTQATTMLSMAIGAVMLMPRGPETVTDTLALAVRRLAKR